MTDRFEYQNNPEHKEKGRNVEILLKIMRHGDREGVFLNDLGRERTRRYAQESGDKELDAVKAIGSPVDPNPNTESGMGRSLETAHIYANEIAGDEQFQTRARDILNYETLVSERPYDHVAIYNSFLPENFSELSPEEKAVASGKAQEGVFKHLWELDSPMADKYKREIAGAYATVVDHYSEVAKRLNPDSKVLIPAGTHGGMMEFLLKYAMAYKNDKGEEVHGLDDIKTIGGEFGFSESFNVDIATDENGEPKPMKVTFDNPARPKLDAYLDPKRIEELKEFYSELHTEQK